jgi:hypothetical protein
MLFVALYVALRMQLGRVKLAVDEAGLSVTETFAPGFGRVRVDRNRINGLWVRVGWDKNGPTGYYDLMIDQDGTKSVRLIGTVAKLQPLIFLCEDLAVQLGVPSDTRTNDFA